MIYFKGPGRLIPLWAEMHVGMQGIPEFHLVSILPEKRCLEQCRFHVWDVGSDGSRSE